MLSEVYVKNFALIEEIRLKFEPGFSVISGETGAGKSILVGALGLLWGGKAASVVVRTGEKEALIEAIFEVEDQELLEDLEEEGLLDGGQVIIRRHISTEGRSRIFINGKSITLTQLDCFGPRLIDLSGQHEQQVLLNEENHLRLLEKAGTLDRTKDVNFKACRDNYNNLYTLYEQLKLELVRCEKQIQDKEKQIDFLRFQLEEIEKAEISDVDEEEKLLQEKGRVKNADLLHEVSHQSGEVLYSGDNSILDQIDKLIIQVEKGANLDSTLDRGLTLLKQVRDPLEEAGRFFVNYSQNLNIDPNRLEHIESRLYQFQQLKRKYGSTLAEICTKREETRKELESLDCSEEIIIKKREKLNLLEKEALAAATKLSEARRVLGKNLEKSVLKELVDLSMPKVSFKINITRPENPCGDDLNVSGLDKICFYLSANPGETLKPLTEIASGGEISRILLAIKRVLGMGLPGVTFIFDEIDAGIGGSVAEMVGRKLNEISKENQVLVVTHLPQIASLADFHYVIEKEVHGNRTKTEVRYLKGLDERENEIARMLGGVSITSKTRAHAKEMLKGAKPS